MNEDSDAPAEQAEQSLANAVDCRTCGACCSFSRDWPRFTLETDADIDLIPPEFVDEKLAGHALQR